LQDPKAITKAPGSFSAVSAGLLFVFFEEQEKKKAIESKEISTVRIGLALAG
jgi:preprotein translocase subunit Sec61beta